MIVYTRKTLPSFCPNFVLTMGYSLPPGLLNDPIHGICSIDYHK